MSEPPEDEDWISTSEAAEILHVTDVRVRQLVDAGRLPAERDDLGHYRYRRAQVEVIANARDARFHHGRPPST